MRWPNFRDYQPWLRKFYEPTACAPAWAQGTQSSPQALFMIGLFKKARTMAPEPDEYDASRWAARLHALQDSSGDVADLDVALTVWSRSWWVPYSWLERREKNTPSAG